MKLLSRYIFFILATTLLSSCYNNKVVGLLQENNAVLPEYEKVKYEKYKIQVNDELVYRLLSSDETITKLIAANTDGATTNQYSYRVYPDGTVDLPFVRNIPVAGLTIDEAERTVEKRFREIIPDATVKISLANKTFTIIGESGAGVFPIVREKMTIYQALSVSGNLSVSSDFRHVKILRESPKGIEVLNFDIRPASIIDSKYYYIYPNDIIYISQDSSSFYKVTNWSSFMALITSSLSMLISVLYYVK